MEELKINGRTEKKAFSPVGISETYVMFTENREDYDFMINVWEFENQRAADDCWNEYKILEAVGPKWYKVMIRDTNGLIITTFSIDYAI